jgi:CHAT domain-containing protein
MASAIFLAPDRARDGRLQAQEIFGLDLRASRLASLSACQTGLGRLGRGDEVVGLSRAFLAAGVRSLALSLWAVDDESTAVLMTAFYRHLTTTTMAEALRRAQLEVLKQRPEPFFWAPFFMMDLSRA